MTEISELVLVYTTARRHARFWATRHEQLAAMLRLKARRSMFRARYLKAASQAIEEGKQ